MEWNPDRVARNIQQAETEDLLDRLTVYREGMEPEALERIEQELTRRGVGRSEIQAHKEKRGTVLLDRNGLPCSCALCSRPATVQVWGWQCLWGKIPLFPRRFRYCEKHRGGKPHDP
jgi:hypothetical protein